ncbi:hypothetical protein J2Z62_000438 [Mycoplasmoides fastidiosum]|uniref:Uncharacterized protein n=1 Tax=Mycoplasmoides fastidiosum TaxID=92758 RepID=A0ABU0LZ75_9BACT|nr:hypothetical protein [Mycoplasmoides fastidiosum]MDQ0514000.1 hypothetical protein [Mycoplasmoides fastidiosum]UUD37587.1 hypothetical protein NPA10_03400 [Mycoplasmoides fastidiosum]
MTPASSKTAAANCFWFAVATWTLGVSGATGASGLSGWFSFGWLVELSGVLVPGLALWFWLAQAAKTKLLVVAKPKLTNHSLFFLNKVIFFH